MPRFWWFVLSCSLLLPALTWAEDFACADASGNLREYIHSRDPSQVPDPLCTLIPKAQTQTQWTLVRSSVGQCTFQGTYCYLKVVGGLVVEKTQAEKNAVTAAITAAATARQVYATEVQTQEYCSTVDLAALTTKLAQVRSGISGRLTPLITAATTVTLLKQALAATAQEFDTLLAVDEKVARCVIALRFAR